VLLEHGKHTPPVSINRSIVDSDMFGQTKLTLSSRTDMDALRIGTDRTRKHPKDTADAEAVSDCCGVR